MTLEPWVLLSFLAVALAQESPCFDKSAGCLQELDAWIANTQIQYADRVKLLMKWSTACSTVKSPDARPYMFRGCGKDTMHHAVGPKVREPEA